MLRKEEQPQMVKRYKVDAASIGELYDELPGEVVNAQDYDALGADLAEERRDHDNCRHNRQENLRNLTRVEDRIRALAAELAHSEKHRAKNRETAVALQLRVSALEAKFAHPYATSINPKSGACAVCGLHGTDAIHVPERERSDFEKAIIAGFTAETASEPTYGDMYQSCNPANRTKGNSNG
jgi:hypothetical protein